MKYRVLEKCVGNKPDYYVQRKSWLGWEDVIAYESKESAIKTAKEYIQNGELKINIVWEGEK